jgi:hypothetical protein
MGPVPVRLFRPYSDQWFLDWLDSQPQVILHTEPLPDAFDWNCKPQALLHVLNSGADEAIWFDSDLMVARNFGDIFDSLSPETIVVAQEAASMPDQGTAVRTSGWGWPVGRALDYTLNSCCVRVTRHHIPMIEKWKSALSDAEYRRVSVLPIEERPVHLKGDQDVLNALLGSQEFSHIPLRVLRSGRELVHCGGALGYSPADRLASLAAPPFFYHAIAGKPWVLLKEGASAGNWFEWYRRLLQEVSPYVLECRRHLDWYPAAQPWLRYRTLLGSLLRFMSASHPALAGFLPAVAAAGIQAFRKFRAT